MSRTATAICLALILGVAGLLAALNLAVPADSPLHVPTYTRVNGQPPAEHEMMRFFQVTPPTVHRMVVTLEQVGLISRQPGKPRCIAILVQEDDLPRLKPGFAQPVKISVTRY